MISSVFASRTACAPPVCRRREKGHRQRPLSEWLNGCCLVSCARGCYVLNLRVRTDRKGRHYWAAITVVTTLLAACGGDEPDDCARACATVQDLCGATRSSPDCIDRCDAAQLDDAKSTNAGLACIATATTCAQIQWACGLSLDGDFRQGSGGLVGTPNAGGSATSDASGGGGAWDGLCNDTCINAADGVCDDGGPNSAYAICQLGSDCADCGLRSALLCSNTCQYSSDNECDDGLAGAVSAACLAGTDCADCGARSLAGPTGCLNTCKSAFDGRCDDGGTGSDIKFCDFGTDCADCGPR